MTALVAYQEFIARCADEFEERERVAKAISEGLRQLLFDAGIPVHVVAARAKTIDSIRGKLLSKDYKNPLREMTDQIAARVIVYRSSEVDAATEVIRQGVNVIKKHSIDKRKALGLREFGYRSYHLVCKLPKMLGSVSIPALRGGPAIFEIQIRSILEHSWAEIEHGVAYKSGADLPEVIKRRFASVAGVLELLETEFQRLAEDTSGLVDEAIKKVRAGVSLNSPLDVPFLLAVFEEERPGGLSFRRAAVEGVAFPFGIERRLVLALKKCGLGTPSKVIAALSQSVVAKALRRYSKTAGVPAQEISHLALSIILIGIHKKALLETYFPDYLTDVAVQAALS